MYCPLPQYKLYKLLHAEYAVVRPESSGTAENSGGTHEEETCPVWRHFGTRRGGDIHVREQHDGRTIELQCTLQELV